MPVRSAVDLYAFHTEALEKPRHDDATDRIHRIESHLESGLADSLRIHGIKSKHCVYMLVGKVFFLDMPYGVNIAEIEIVLLCAGKDLRSFLCIQELPFLIQELQGIPLLRIVGSGQDYPSVSLFKDYSHFCSRCRSISGLYHIHAAGHKSPAYDLLHHLAGDPGILADDHPVPFA